MKKFSKSFAIFFLFLALSAIAWAMTSRFKNLDTIVTQIGFRNFRDAKSSHIIKIAVLDNGFKNYAAEVGKNLPANTVYHPGPIPVEPASEEAHGLYMAELVSALLATTPAISYELHLYSSFGYSNLESAVNDVISKNFDLVLYAQVWEYGGNGDGRGFINTLINKALKSGVIWINAAGNFATSTYRTKVTTNDDAWVRLPSPNDTVKLRCEANQVGYCPLRAVLSWNDFSDDVDAGSDKDLDLILTDDTLKIVGSSALQQMKQIPEGSVGASLYPREIISQQVPPGQYFLRIKDRSRNFDKRRDQLRITVSGDNIKFLNTTAGETLLAPADNPGVLTVGAFDSTRSSSSQQRKKPELVSPSLLTLEDGAQYLGSSNAAAITTAAAVIVKALNPKATRNDVLKALAGEVMSTVATTGQGLPLETLGFQSNQAQCFRAVSLPAEAPAALHEFMGKAKHAAAIAVATSKGIKIFTQPDPFPLVGVYRVSADDMLVAGPNGFEALPRSNQDYLPRGFFEVVQVPLSQVICSAQTTNPTTGVVGRRLRLSRSR